MHRLYLEDTLEVTNHAVNVSAPWARKKTDKRVADRDEFDVHGKAIDVVSRPDVELTLSELSQRYEAYKPQVLNLSYPHRSS
eukprot:SAG31_NODE_26799_length_436_cov_1.062315_1_plen_82_part_00